MMAKHRCQDCHWWNGEDDAETLAARYQTGQCERIHSGSALRKNQPARLFPAGTPAWLETKFDFVCPLFEAKK